MDGHVGKSRSVEGYVPDRQAPEIVVEHRGREDTGLVVRCPAAGQRGGDRRNRRALPFMPLRMVVTGVRPSRHQNFDVARALGRRSHLDQTRRRFVRRGGVAGAGRVVEADHPIATRRRQHARRACAVGQGES